VEAAAVAQDHRVIQTSHAGPRTTLLVHTNGHAAPHSWTAHDVPLAVGLLALTVWWVRKRVT
jgi:hypothetical protein